MKSLYDINGHYTTEAGELCDKAKHKLRSVVDDTIRDGYSFREICGILHHSVMDLELDISLENRSKPKAE